MQQNVSGLKIVNKKSKGDCLLCCAAMLTGRTRNNVLKEVKTEYDKKIKAYYLPIIEFVKYLNSYGLHYGLTIKPNYIFTDCEKSITIEISLDRHALVTVPNTKGPEEFAHAVVWDGYQRKILDPCFKVPQLLIHYPKILEWSPISEL